MMLWILSALAHPVEGTDYLLEMKVVTSARIPFAGNRDVVTRSLARVRFFKNGDTWIQEQTPCAVEVEGGRVSFPEAFVANLPTRRKPVSLAEGKYRFDPGPAFVGIPVGTKVLPTKKNDPMVLDHDGDGHPGATIQLSVPVFGTVELYLVQASHSVLKGTATEEGFAGEIEVIRLEQSTLAASVGVFAVSPKVELVDGASTWSILPDTEGRCSVDGP